ncbi:RNA-binding domain-containing protein [Didymella exigua CBS 183.55]|uniref:Nucleolar protein 12 n=1 Tax=Didymella exigua CBS 183.55 TaxID=1150837 RepID=A0A6A5RWH0_9PLEO|nr:RNA-binding domain-containing protein [Didymella exigua CBS 183.55]KAF1932232.1 RNA-binding domain-containing protein [Didymella exigua CBS 183.55]
MAKSKVKQTKESRGSKPSAATAKPAFDPALSSLFASSLGPLQVPPKQRYGQKLENRAKAPVGKSSEEGIEDEYDDDESSDEAAADEDEDSSDEESSERSDDGAELAKLREAALAGEHDKPNKKRKRGGQEEIEDKFMRKLARQEEKEEEERQKKRKTKEVAAEDDDEDMEDASETSDAADAPEEDGEKFEIPQHESLAKTDGKTDEELEKAARTVFLSNVSVDCINSKSAEKALKKHLESFIADLADEKPPHKIESIRFRSTAFSSSLPKRAAFAKKEIMDATTKSTNAYAVYTTKTAAREAVKRLNGSVLLDRHLHVDWLAHPTKVDNRRCVFVGNLPFVDDESKGVEPEEGKKKKIPADIEEGLWQQFSKCGKIENVRVIRDAQTRIGKGFAYVQFTDENGVEAALQLNEKKFPPMLPRVLRVTRCRAEKKKDKPRGPAPSSERPGKKGAYQKKFSAEEKSQQGRAKAMLGKGGAAKVRESFVFEGHRASEGQGKSGLKFKGSNKNAAKNKKGPNGRKSRSSAWKSSGKK